MVAKAVRPANREVVASGAMLVRRDRTTAKCATLVRTNSERSAVSGVRPWRAVASFAMAAATVLLSCKDGAKESAARAEEHAGWLSQLAEKDVAEVERGLPAGAGKVAELYKAGEDPRNDLRNVHVALRNIRRDVPDLAVAKSTFFALADENAVAIRNDLDQDVMAGQNLAQAFPAIAKVGKEPLVTTTGVFSGVQNDRDWIAAAPVRRGEKTVGILVTGWTFRSFARHLKTAFDIEWKDRQAKGVEKGKTPLLYVAVFDGSGAYGAPLTPPVNEKALAAEDLVAKTASGSYRAVVEIDERSFGLGAVRVPRLGPQVGIAVLRSEL